MKPQTFDKSIAAELDAARAWAHAVAADLSDDEWRRRPEPAKWSIGEQIVHLNLASEIYLQVFRQAVARGRQEGLVGEGPFRRDFKGWLLGWLIEPPVRIRTKTTARFMPGELAPAAETLRTFDDLQGEMTAVLGEAAGLDLGRIIVTSPFDPRIRYNLISGFRLIPAHQRHHLWLAERTRQGFGR